MTPSHLSPVAARDDLTNRECAKLLGSVLAGLCQLAPAQAVKEALTWWAERPELFDLLASMPRVDPWHPRAPGEAQ